MQSSWVTWGSPVVPQEPTELSRKCVWSWVVVSCPHSKKMGFHGYNSHHNWISGAVKFCSTIRQSFLYTLFFFFLPPSGLPFILFAFCNTFAKQYSIYLCLLWKPFLSCTASCRGHFWAVTRYTFLILYRYPKTQNTQGVLA